MKRMNELLKVATLTSLVISFVSFGAAAIGGLTDSSILMMFWYLGLTGIWVILMASVVASVMFLYGFSGKSFQQYGYRLEGHRHQFPHTTA